MLEARGLKSACTTQPDPFSTKYFKGQPDVVRSPRLRWEDHFTPGVQSYTELGSCHCHSGLGDTARLCPKQNKTQKQAMRAHLPDAPRTVSNAHFGTLGELSLVAIQKCLAGTEPQNMVSRPVLLLSGANRQVSWCWGSG